MSVFTEAFRIERATAKPRSDRTPLLARLGRIAARTLPRWQTVRTAAMSLGGFGMLTAGAWHVHLVAGLAVGGISLLVLEALGGDRG